MKRAELKVGDVLFHATNAQWERPKYGAGTGRAVKVAAIEPHQTRGISWTKENQFMQVPNGTGVLVEVLDFMGRTVQEVVNLAHLRGPYEQTAARVAAYVAERDQMSRVRDEAEDQLRAAARAVAAGVAKLGYPKADEIYTAGGGQKVVVPVELFVAMFEGLREDWTFKR